METETLVIGGHDYPLVEFDGLGTVYADPDPIMSDEWATLITIKSKLTELDGDDLDGLRELVDTWRDALRSFITEGAEHWDKATKKKWLGVKNLSRITKAYAEFVNDDLPTVPS